MRKEKRKPMYKLMYERKKAGFTQIQLSKKVGSNDGLIYAYEAGSRIPNAEMLVKIANALNCKVDDIL